MQNTPVEFKKLKVSLRKSEYATYPLIEEFFRPDKKISKSSEKELLDSIDFLINQIGEIKEFEKYPQYKVTLENTKLWINRVVKVARKRDQMDSQNALLGIIKSLKEFSFFTSAVNLGVFVYFYHLDQGYSLIILGVVGVFLYFMNDLLRLNATLRLRKSVTNEITYDNFKDISRLVEHLETYTVEEIKAKELELEKIIISPEASNTLNYQQVIQLKHLYFHSIKGNMMKEIRESDAPETVKKFYESLNRYFENIVQAFVFSMASVDANRPIPKLKSIKERLLDPEGLIKYVGYIMLNAISYNLLFTLLKDNLYTALVVNFMALAAFNLITLRMEVFMHRELK